MNQDPSQLSDAELLAIIGQMPQAPAPQQAPRQAAPARPAPAALSGVQGQIESILPGVRITSARRTPERQRQLIAEWEANGRRGVRPADNSFHLRGQAFDLAPPPGVSMTDLERQLRQSGLPFAELINEGDHIHVAWNGEPVDAPSAPQPRAPGSPRQVADLDDAELLALAEGQGVSVRERAGMPREWFIANGIALGPNGEAPTTEAMLAAGFEPDPDKPGHWRRGDPRSAGHVQALEEEREKAAQRAEMGISGVDDPDFTAQTTAPLNDELAWLAGGAMQNFDNLGRLLTGRDIEVSALDRARALRDMSREGQERFEQEHPGQAIGGGVLGGFAFAPARGAALPAFAGRMGQAGGVGFGYGAAEGDGVLGRLQSGAAGAVISTATAGTMEGGGAATRGLLGGIERARAPRGNLPNRSERRVGGTIERALERDGLTPDDLAGALPNMVEGKLPFEAGGENLIGLAETMAQAPGPARRSLLSAVGNRGLEANNRVAGRLADSFGAQGNGFQAIRQRVRLRGEEADAGMAAIADRAVPLDDASVQAFRSRLSARAVRDAAEEAIAELSPEGAAAARRLLGLADGAMDSPAGSSNVGRMSIADIEAAAEREGIRLSISEGRNGITLSRIIVPAERRSQGSGSAMMQRIIDHADNTGQRVLLTPDGSFGGSVPRLREFYRRFGFRPNTGRSRDLSVSEAMIREPQPPAGSGGGSGGSGGAQITIREAQDISYALNEAASRAYRGGFNSRGEALKTLANTIRGNARQAVPEYDGWLKSFGDASETIDAMRTGQNVFAKANERNAMSAAELAERWQGWSEPARESYRLGIGEAVLDKVRGRGGVTTMRQLLRDNELADRVRIAFDSEDAFLRFMQTADDEVSMANVNNQILGGSPTARRALGAADVNQQGVGVSDALDFATDFTSPIGLTRQGVKLLARSLPRRDRSILGDDELNGLLGRALTDEAEMTRLLNLAQASRSVRDRVNSRLRGMGLLSLPGSTGAGQERARGLLTANP